MSGYMLQKKTFKKRSKTSTSNALRHADVTSLSELSTSGKFLQATTTTKKHKTKHVDVFPGGNRGHLEQENQDVLTDHLQKTDMNINMDRNEP